RELRISPRNVRKHKAHREEVEFWIGSRAVFQDEIPLSFQCFVLMNRAESHFDAPLEPRNSKVFRVQLAGFGKVLVREDQIVGDGGLLLGFSKPLRNFPKMRHPEKKAHRRVSRVLEISGGQEPERLWEILVTPRRQALMKKTLCAPREVRVRDFCCLFRCEPHRKVSTTRVDDDDEER